MYCKNCGNKVNKTEKIVPLLDLISLEKIVDENLFECLLCEEEFEKKDLISLDLYLLEKINNIEEFLTTEFGYDPPHLQEDK